MNRAILTRKQQAEHHRVVTQQKELIHLVKAIEQFIATGFIKIDREKNKVTVKDILLVGKDETFKKNWFDNFKAYMILLYNDSPEAIEKYKHQSPSFTITLMHSKQEVFKC